MGSAYLFEDADGSWRETLKLLASDAHDADFSGDSVAIRGDRVFIGAPRAAPLFPRTAQPQRGDIAAGRATRARWELRPLSGRRRLEGCRWRFTS